TCFSGLPSLTNVPTLLRHERWKVRAVSVCSNVRVRKLDLVDQLVGAREQRRRDCQPERLGDLDVNDQLEISRFAQWGGWWAWPPSGSCPRRRQTAGRGGRCSTRKTSGPPHPCTHEYHTWPAGGCWQPRRRSVTCRYM